VSEAAAALPPAAPRSALAPRWQARASAALASYLPLLVMGLLALGSWWLVSTTPMAEGPAVETALRHEPDYTMRAFVVQRFGRDGAMKAQIEGDVAVHYPDTDTLEIENPRIRAIGSNGRVLHATAERALANGDGSEVQLRNRARVVREAAPNEEAIEFRSDFLHVFVNTERVQTHLPVTVVQGATELHAAGLAYDNLARVAELKGRMQGVFVDPASKGRR
jgi:lipopolysaccharide export system protein LptC